MASWRGSISALVGTVLAGSVVGALGSPDVAAAHGADRVLDERTSAKDIDARIDAFWRWWRTAAPRLDSALEAKQTTAVTEELSAQIGALDPRLAWETGPGLKGARHQLVLSAEGDIALRAVTERWISRAPPSDGRWELYPARQPHRRGGEWALNLTELGVTLDLARGRVRLEPDEHRELVHVVFHHPALVKLDASHRQQAAFLTLDALLGEDGVERSVGAIRISADPLPDGKPLDALVASVDALKRVATGERFAILERRTAEGRPVIATVNVALKRVDHLLLDHHVTVTIPLREPTPLGLTTSAEAEVLNAVEDELLEKQGRDAVYIGRETGEGRRVLHFHASGSGSFAQRAQEWAKRHAPRKPEIVVSPDPRWEVLDRW